MVEAGLFGSNFLDFAVRLKLPALNRSHTEVATLGHYRNLYDLGRDSLKLSAEVSLIEST